MQKQMKKFFFLFNKIFFHLSRNNIFDPLINWLNELGSIEQAISGPGRSILSVKCLSKIDAPNATAPKQA